MSFLFDIELENGEKFDKCYFVLYQIPIRIGKAGYIAMYADDHISTFDQNGNEIKGLNINECKFNAIYYEQTGADVTDLVINNFNGHIPKQFLIREIIKLEN